MFVYAAPRIFEAVMHPKGEVVELTIKMAFNEAAGLEVYVLLFTPTESALILW
jgi:hypothetical protein